MRLLRSVTRRQFWLISGTLLFVFAWVSWYYAVWLGAQLKDEVYISIFEVWPGVTITLSFLFILPWDGLGNNARTAMSSFSRQRRVGGPCTPSCLKTVIGSSCFMFGVLWGVLSLALHRFFVIGPHSKTPKSVMPGVMILIHIMCLSVTGVCILIYTELPEASEPMICCGGSAEGDDEETGVDSDNTTL